MVGHFFAIRGAFLQQWRVTASVRELVLISIFQTPLAIGLGWVARSSDEPAVVATVAIGAGLMIRWSMAVFYTAFAMVDELFGGTLELNMLSCSRSSSWSGTCSGSPRRAPSCRAVSWEGSDGIRQELRGTGLALLPGALPLADPSLLHLECRPGPLPHHGALRADRPLRGRPDPRGALRCEHDRLRHRAALHQRGPPVIPERPRAGHAPVPLRLASVLGRSLLREGRRALPQRPPRGHLYRAPGGPPARLRRQQMPPLGRASSPPLQSPFPF